MNKLALALAMLASAHVASAQNLYKRARHAAAAIADTRATGVGDILTVIIKEATKIKQEDKVNRTNSTSLAARLESFNLKDNLVTNNVLPKLDAREERSTTGDAKQEKDSNVEFPGTGTCTRKSCTYFSVAPLPASAERLSGTGCTDMVKVPFCATTAGAVPIVS